MNFVLVSPLTLSAHILVRGTVRFNSGFAMLCVIEKNTLQV